jgi:hypothetical protein
MKLKSGSSLEFFDHCWRRDTLKFLVRRQNWWSFEWTGQRYPGEPAILFISILGFCFCYIPCEKAVEAMLGNKNQ